MDWTIHWFMFPISICVATTAMPSGIGGAALFTPIFPIVFPLIGPEYPLATPAAAVGAALATAAFGFARDSSGTTGAGLSIFARRFPSSPCRSGSSGFRWAGSLGAKSGEAPPGI